MKWPPSNGSIFRNKRALRLYFLNIGAAFLNIDSCPSSKVIKANGLFFSIQLFNNLEGSKT